MGIRNMGISRVEEGVSDSPVGICRDVFVYLFFLGWVRQVMYPCSDKLIFYSSSYIRICQHATVHGCCAKYLKS